MTTPLDLAPHRAFIEKCNAPGSRFYIFDNLQQSLSHLRELVAEVERLQRELEESRAFIDEAVDKAPEPLRRLGVWLSQILDEDQWKTADRMLLAAATAPPHDSQNLDTAAREP